MPLGWIAAALVFAGACWRLARIFKNRRPRVEERLEVRRDRWEERDRGIFAKSDVPRDDS